MCVGLTITVSPAVVLLYIDFDRVACCESSVVVFLSYCTIRTIRTIIYTWYDIVLHMFHCLPCIVCALLVLGHFLLVQTGPGRIVEQPSWENAAWLKCTWPMDCYDMGTLVMRNAMS